MSRAVMQQALDVLEDIGGEWGFISKSTVPKRIEVITALREELAKPDHIPDAGKMVGPEPELFIHPLTLEMASAHVGAWKPGHELPGYIALYTSPPQRQPLTDEQIEALADRHLDVGDGERHHHFVTGDIDFARAIEAAHEIKEQS